MTDLARTAALTAQVSRIEIEEKALERIMPREATAADVHVFARICQRVGLDPFVKEIYAIPNKRRGGLDYVVGIDGWCKIVSQDPRFRGIEFDEEFDAEGRLVSIVCTLHVDGLLKPVIVRERLVECARPTDPWRQMPARMLRHCALKQAARVAFGVGGVSDPDEHEVSQADAPATAGPAALPPATGAASLQAALDAALPGPAHRAAEPAAVGGAPQSTDGPAAAAGRKDAPVPAPRLGDEAAGSDGGEVDALAAKVAAAAQARGVTRDKVNTPAGAMRVARSRASEGDGDVVAELVSMLARLESATGTQTGSAS